MNSVTLFISDKIVDLKKKKEKDWDGRPTFSFTFRIYQLTEGKRSSTLKPKKTPPSNKLLDQFEKDLFKLIRKIKFRKQFNSFQTKINKDIDDIINFDWVRADKTINFYEIKPSNYKKIIKNKITDSCKLDRYNTLLEINNDTAKFARKLNIEDRMGKMIEKKMITSYLWILSPIFMTKTM